MAIALVQSVEQFLNGTIVTSTTIPITGVTTGNTLVALVAHFQGGHPIVTTLTDNMGNMYSLVPNSLQDTNAFTGSEIWYAKNVTGGNLILSFTFSSGDEQTIYVTEFSGADLTAPIYGGNGISATASPIGPSLTSATSGDLLVTIVDPFNTSSGFNSPWITGGTATSGVAWGYYEPGSPGTYNAVSTPATSQEFASSGAILTANPPIFNLSLSDSVTMSDSQVDAFSIPLSDSLTSSDTAPNSFSVQSDFIAPVNVPIVEQLTTQLIPASVKVYYRTEE